MQTSWLNAHQLLLGAISLMACSQELSELPTRTDAGIALPTPSSEGEPSQADAGEENDAERNQDEQEGGVAPIMDGGPQMPTVDASPSKGEGPALYSESRPYRTGRFQVSKLHNLYFELAGDPEGIPLIVLHGGPGGRAGAFTRQFFDPQRFKVLLFDQRGAGRSRPRAEFRENTTQLLIEDIERLREHLGFDEPALFFGGSWGSTLAVAYAETHPEKVAGLALGGVFLCSKAEIDHFYHGGTAPFYPKNFAALKAVMPHPGRMDYPAQLFAMIIGDDPARSKRAINAWARYEIRMTRMDMTDALADRIVRRSNFDAFSTLENHYMMNGCFLEEGQLLNEAHRIAHIPTSIVNGRHDTICPPKTAVDLSRQLKRAKLEIVPLAAHSGRDAPLAEARLRGIDWVASSLR